MAIVYSPNVIEIAVVHGGLYKPMVNVWHMWFDRELGTDTMEAVVRDFANNWQDHIMGQVDDTIALESFEWRSLDPNDSSVGTIQPDAAKATLGGVAGFMLPPNTAYLIHKNTDARPRGRRDGRCYLAGVNEDRAHDSGMLNQAAQDSLNVALAAFYNGVSDTSGTAAGDRYPCVLETTVESRTAGTQPVTISSRRVTSLTVDGMLATQRERLR